MLWAKRRALRDIEKDEWDCLKEAVACLAQNTAAILVEQWRFFADEERGRRKVEGQHSQGQIRNPQKKALAKSEQAPTYAEQLDKAKSRIAQLEAEKEERYQSITRQR
jgi:hypothetical protein